LEIFSDPEPTGKTERDQKRTKNTEKRRAKKSWGPRKRVGDKRRKRAMRRGTTEKKSSKETGLKNPNILRLCGKRDKGSKGRELGGGEGPNRGALHSLPRRGRGTSKTAGAQEKKKFGGRNKPPAKQGVRIRQAKRRGPEGHQKNQGEKVWG